MLVLITDCIIQVIIRLFYKSRFWTGQMYLERLSEQILYMRKTRMHLD